MRSRIIFYLYFLFRCTLNTPLATIEKKINDFYFQVSRAESNRLLGELSRSHQVVVNCRRFCFHRGQQTGATAKEWLYPSLLLAQCTSWLWCAQSDCSVPSLLQSVYLSSWRYQACLFHSSSVLVGQCCAAVSDPCAWKEELPKRSFLILFECVHFHVLFGPSSRVRLKVILWVYEMMSVGFICSY